MRLGGITVVLALAAMTPGCTALTEGRDAAIEAGTDGGPLLRDQLDGRPCDEDDACRSGHCENGFCCEEGVCCSAADDCPAGFSRPSRCDDSGENTECQGQRLDAVCRDSRCASVAIDDDSGCSGAQRSCGEYVATRCSHDVDQPAAACATECSSTDGCEGRYVCMGGRCEAPIGSCQSCSDAEGCQGELQCGHGSCCAADFARCCSEDIDCEDGFGCDSVTCGCHDSCLSDGDRSHCAAGHVCIDRRCVDLKRPGAACAESFECASGYCVDGVCCSEACDEECHACDSEGSCEPEPPGAACGDPSAEGCDVPDTCDEQARCVDNVAPASHVCRPLSAEAPECDVAELCDGAGKSCPDDGWQPADTPCGDSSNAECDAPDRCDGQGQCVDHVAPATRVCRQAASACDAIESCDGSIKICPSDRAREDGATCAGDPGRCCSGVCDADGIGGADLAGACRSAGPSCLGQGSWGYAAANEGEICAGPTCACGTCSYSSICAESGSGQTQCSQTRCQHGQCSMTESWAGDACTCTRSTEGEICDGYCSGGIEPVCFFYGCQGGECGGTAF